MCSVISSHLKALRAGGYAEGSVIAADGWLRNLESFAAGRELTELGPQDLEQWHRELTWRAGPRGSLYSQNTVNQAVGAVRRFYRYLIAQGTLVENPAATLVTPSVRASKPVWKNADTRRFLASPDLDTPTGVRDRAILGVLLETGMPRAACARLDLGDLCFDTAALLATGRSRRIHSLGDGLMADLERYLRKSRPLLLSPERPTQALFLSIHGRRMTGAALYQVFNRHKPR